MRSSVLIVDDEADLVATCARLLRRRGYDVACAPSRREALEAVATDAHALVVADLRLPDGDGLDIVRAARARALSRPVIVITGFGSPRIRQEALAAGASIFLQKPFSLTELADLVDKLLAPDVPPASV